MPNDGDITNILLQLTNNDQRAAAALWDRYFDQLVRLAANKLRSVPRRLADEEDVALSALNSFMQAAQAGRFPDLSDREDLWKLLVTITIRKTNALKRKLFAQKRGSNQVRGESAFLNHDDPDAPVGDGLAGWADAQPTPEMAAEFAENVEQLLNLLDVGALREVAQLRLEGYSNAEIATRLNRHEGTIERKLNLIRRIWDEWLTKVENSAA